jgi:hypothetical protein
MIRTTTGLPCTWTPRITRITRRWPRFVLSPVITCTSASGVFIFLYYYALFKLKSTILEWNFRDTNPFSFITWRSKLDDYSEVYECKIEWWSLRWIVSHQISSLPCKLIQYVGDSIIWVPYVRFLWQSLSRVYRATWHTSLPHMIKDRKPINVLSHLHVSHYLL